MKIDILNLPALTRTAAVANSHRFLYSRYRQDQSIESFSKTATTEEFFAALEAIALKQSRTFDDTVLAYCMLVAITYKQSDEIRAAIQKRGIPKLPWAREILEGHLTSAPETRLVVVAYEGTKWNVAGAAQTRTAITQENQQAVFRVTPSSASVTSNSPNLVVRPVDND